MKKDFQKDLQDSKIPQFPPAAVQKISKKYNMVKITVENFSKDELRMKWNEIIRKESWDNEWETCRIPEMLHKGACTRKTEVGEAELTKLWKSWNTFKNKMGPIRKWKVDEEEKTKIQSDILVGMNKIAEVQNMNMAVMIEAMKGKTTKLVKPAKVLGWTIDER